MLRVEDLCPELMHFCFQGGAKGAGGHVAVRGKEMRRALHLLLLTSEEQDRALALRSVGRPVEKAMSWPDSHALVVKSG